jgi:membrane associated rhomboid family serine protease
LTAVAWLLGNLFLSPADRAFAGGFIPARIGGLPDDPLPVPAWLTPLTATLVHAGLLHLGFNLLMHLFCGRTVEAILGARGLLVLYVVGAYAAAAGQYAAGPDELVPMVGASGAVSAEIGAYALLFGRNRSKIADPRLAMLVHALWLGAAWVVLQMMVGYAFNFDVPTIAWPAHIGGFLAGLMLAKPLLLLRWRGA